MKDQDTSNIVNLPEDDLFINPSAVIVEAATITPELLAEYATLTGEAADAAKAHIARCVRTGQKPVPVAEWIHCPICSYAAPESLVSHFKQAHGGKTAVAAEYSRRLTIKLGKPTIVLPEQLQVNNEAYKAKSRIAGAKGAAASKAKRDAEKAAQAAQGV